MRRTVRKLLPGTGRARWLLASLMIVAGLLVLPHRSTFAQTSPINASLFILPASAFPDSSVVSEHQVETNDKLLEEGGIVHYGPSYVDEGRITGYFESAATVLNDSAGAHAASTYYLVSIFGTNQQAQFAFSQQRDGYDSLTSSSAIVTPTRITGVGDENYAALYTVSHDRGATEQSELFFARGPVFVEVWQTYDSHFPDLNGLTAAQSTIASDLDAIAMSALQSLPPVTDTPVPTSTGTGNPVPTATDTGNPAPTSTPTPAPTDTPTSNSGQPPESTVTLNPTVTGAVPGCGSDYYACATPTPTTPIVFDTFVARAEGTGPDMAYDLGTPGLSRVRMGSNIMLAVYFSLRNVPPQSTAVVQMQVQRGYGVHFHFQSSPMAVGTLANTYRVTAPFQPKSIGKDTLVARVSIGGQSRQTSASFQVVRKLQQTLQKAASRPRNQKSTSAQQPASSAPAKPLLPSSFALPGSALPAGSQVRHQGVESNGAAQSTLVPHLGSDSLAQLGRQTGYYLDSVQPNGGHAVYTQYLVSIFANAGQSTTAFDQQQAGYQRLAHLSTGHYTSAPSHRGYGTHDAFGTSLVSVRGKQFYTREEYFARGRVLVEVVQSYYVSDSKPYGHIARGYLWSIAGKLAAVARASQ